MMIGGTAYENIYEWMKGYCEIDEGYTNEQIINDFFVNNRYLKPEGYDDLENNMYKIILIDPNGKEQERLSGNAYNYQIINNGNYTFKAKNVNGDIGAITIKVGNIIEEKYSNIYSSTELYTDKNGDTAWIPKGFAVGTNRSKNTEIDTVEKGLVITDKVDSEGNSIGNEFVWVPVNITGTTQEEKEASFEAIRTDGYFNNGYLQKEVLNGTVTEPYTSGYSTEVEEYNLMKTSVIEHGGFYIGRYEAGTITPRYNTANGTTKMVVQRKQYPYIYVGWGSNNNNYTSTITYNSKNQGYGAVYLSKNMYTNGSTFGVTSTLCYGVQWDATMKFVKDSTHSISDSINWGNYSDSTFIYIGKFSRNPDTNTLPKWSERTNNKKAKNYDCLLTTGASEQNKAKNIYDLAGNVEEWTMEYHINYSSRVQRGR